MGYKRELKRDKFVINTYNKGKLHYRVMIIFVSIFICTFHFVLRWVLGSKDHTIDYYIVCFISYIIGFQLIFVPIMWRDIQKRYTQLMNIQDKNID